MTQVLVLGYRKGLDEAITRRGLTPVYIVEKMKSDLAGRDHVLVAHMEDAQEVLRATHRFAGNDIKAVVTGHEEAVFTAAVLRGHLGLVGDRDFARTLRFRDKMLQKSALPPGIPRARCEYLTPQVPFSELALRLGDRVVVKPANGYGSARTAVVRSPDDLARYWEDNATSSGVQVVAESFVTGHEIHLDGVWLGGELKWSCLSRYVEAPMRWAEGGILAGGILSRRGHETLYEQAEVLTRESLTALDAPDTVFHLEAFTGSFDEPLSPRLAFGECAARIAGALVPEVIKLTYGVDLYDAVLDLALGQVPDFARAAATPQKYHGYVFLRRVAGVDLAEEDFRQRFDLHEISYPTDPDAQVGSYGRVGHAIIGHGDNDRLHSLLAEIAAFNLRGPQVANAPAWSHHG